MMSVYKIIRPRRTLILLWFADSAVGARHKFSRHTQLDMPHAGALTTFVYERKSTGVVGKRTKRAA